jgi:hypothetical protein
MPRFPSTAGHIMLPDAPVSVRAVSLPTRSSAELLSAARQGLVEATVAGTVAERYSLAHVAALRAAAAVLAARARPTGSRRGRPASVWTLLAEVAPVLEEWAQFFAAGATKRAAADAGLPAVTQREADDLLRDAETFLEVVEAALAGASQPLLTAATGG